MAELDEVLKGLDEEVANKVRESVSGLVKKKDELLADVAKKNELLNELKTATKNDKLDKDGLRDYFTKLEEEKKRAAELEELQGGWKKSTEELLNKTKAEYEEKINSFKTREKARLLDSEIASGLSEIGLAGAKAKLAEAYIRNQVSVEESKDGYSVLFGSDKKPKADFFKEFLTSDIAKELLPNGNSGGGAGGRNASSGGSSSFRNAKTNAERFEAIKRKINN